MGYELLQQHLLLLSHALLPPGQATGLDGGALALGAESKEPGGCSHRLGALLEPDELGGGLRVGGRGIVVSNQRLDFAALVDEGMDVLSELVRGILKSGRGSRVGFPERVRVDRGAEGFGEEWEGRKALIRVARFRFSGKVESSEGYSEVLLGGECGADNAGWKVC